MADEPKRPADEAAGQPQSQPTMPQWQPPGAATRSMTLSALPNAAELQRSHPPNAGQSGLRPASSVDTPMAFEHTLSVMPHDQTGPIKEPGVGDIIGERYVIDIPISSGGFGAVFRAKDRQIPNHQVALKLLHKPAASEEDRQAALRELTLIASVSHPLVVQFKDYGWFEGRLWFAMPWYSGQTLDQRFSTDGGKPELTRAEARPIFERIARGLAAMHGVGIHHHDIKPENIFLADLAGFDGGLPVLLDLGIAAKRGEGPKGLTPEYAAPEVAGAVLGDRERPIGAAADVFSLALVRRNLLEPETAPEVGGEIVALLHSRATEKVPRFERRELRYLQPTFDKLLNLDPSERPTADELAEELAILTAPEERREARAKLLRRIVPIVLVGALIVALLMLQLRQQKTQITVQGEQLSKEQQQSATLRKQQSDQLQQLEAQNERIGSQGERLQQAIGIARNLSDELDRSEQDAATLRGRIKKLGDERTALQTDIKALESERDGLLDTRSRLTAERDDLVRSRDALSVQRDNLASERDRLTAQRKALEDERNAALAQRNDTLRERDRVQGELDATRKKLETITTERDATRKAYDELRNEVKTLRAQVGDLNDELDKTRRALDAQRKAAAAQKAAPPQKVDPGKTVATPPPAGVAGPTNAWR